MDGNLVMIRAAEPTGQCEDGLRLRQRVLKLRWLGCDAEADQLAEEIVKLKCDLPCSLPLCIPETD